MKVPICLFIVCLFVLILNSCNKTEVISPVICDIRGTYTGTSTTSGGSISTAIYKLQNNNLASGYTSPTGAAVSVGNYQNSCDSVTINVFYMSNYYLIQGGLNITSIATTITGTYKNLSVLTDYGTFKITK